MVNRVSRRPSKKKSSVRSGVKSEEPRTTLEFALFLAHIATGRSQGERFTAIESARECIRIAGEHYDYKQLIKNGSLTNKGFTVLVYIIQQGIEKRMSEVFALDEE